MIAPVSWTESFNDDGGITLYVDDYLHCGVLPSHQSSIACDHHSSFLIVIDSVKLARGS
jgi:hypothetical protein